MTRKIVGTGCLLALALAVAGIALLVHRIYFSGPSVQVTGSGASKEVGLLFLGEYCIGTSRIRLTDTEEQRVVWEVSALEDDDTGICRFTLKRGENAVHVGQPADRSFAVVHPKAGTFRLSAGKSYLLEVWGNNGWGRQGLTRRRLYF